MSKASKTAWQLMDKLKRTQLQRIATLIGAPLTGTKPQLLASIEDVLAQSSRKKHPKDGELRVLSIDMGIRNLAYAFLTYKPGQKFEHRPMLHTWQRTNLLQAEAPGHSPIQEGVMQAIPDTQIGSEHDFEPSTMAQRAYHFTKYCLSLKPTNVLVERQRFRSGGRSAVQEWTLRVGMLEAMFHATFLAINQENRAHNTSVESVLPMRVNKFWFIDEDLPATGKQAKQAKIALVADMLQATNTSEAKFDTSKDVLSKIPSFKQSLPRGARLQKSVKQAEKLDDMSDALLQGLAWLQWQKNRGDLLEHGPSALGIE